MVSAKFQSFEADVNEILFGYYLTDRWDDFENSISVKNEFGTRSNKLKTSELKDQDGRARKQAEVTKQWLMKNGYGSEIVKKWWAKQDSSMITKAVGYKVDLDKNPLDILIKTKSGKFLGLSAKSSGGTGRIPFKNPGLGSIERDSGLKLKHYYKNAEDQMLKQFNQIPKSRPQRKQWFKNNRSFYDKNISKSKFVQMVFEGIRNDMYSKIDTLSDEKLWDYIKDNWMDAGYLEPPYIIVTGRGKSGKYHAEIDDRLDLNIKKLKLTKVGWDKIRVFSDGNELLNMRVKFESTQMATSIKFSGE